MRVFIVTQEWYTSNSFRSAVRVVFASREAAETWVAERTAEAAIKDGSWFEIDEREVHR